MAELPEQQPQGFRFLPEFAEAIAEAATSWAALEYAVNAAIWVLADVKPGLGACLTAQIFTMNARMDALISLLNLRRVDKKLVKAANVFASSMREAQDARNRTVHDYWMNDRHEPANMGKMIITAQRAPRFKIVSVKIEELRADVQKIHDKRFEFEKLRRDINAALPTLPSIPREELYPIDEIPKPL